MRQIVVSATTPLQGSTPLSRQIEPHNSHSPMLLKASNFMLKPDSAGRGSFSLSSTDGDLFRHAFVRAPWAEFGELRLPRKTSQVVAFGASISVCEKARCCLELKLLKPNIAVWKTSEVCLKPVCLQCELSIHLCSSSLHAAERLEKVFQE